MSKPHDNDNDADAANSIAPDEPLDVQAKQELLFSWIKLYKMGDKSVAPSLSISLALTGLSEWLDGNRESAFQLFEHVSGEDMNQALVRVAEQLVLLIEDRFKTSEHAMEKNEILALIGDGLTADALREAVEHRDHQQKGLDDLMDRIRNHAGQSEEPRTHARLKPSPAGGKVHMCRCGVPADTCGDLMVQEQKDLDAEVSQS